MLKVSLYYLGMSDGDAEPAEPFLCRISYGRIAVKGRSCLSLGIAVHVGYG